MKFQFGPTYVSGSNNDLLIFHEIDAVAATEIGSHHNEPTAKYLQRHLYLANDLSTLMPFAVVHCAFDLQMGIATLL